MMKINRTLTACLLLLSAGSALAQQKPASPEVVDQDIGEIVNVNVVNVDVYVTDKSGKRIQGLTMDDFEIFENGKKVAITNFYSVEGGKAKMVGDEPVPEASAAPAPARPGAVQAPQLPED